MDEGPPPPAGAGAATAAAAVAAAAAAGTADAAAATTTPHPDTTGRVVLVAVDDTPASEAAFAFVVQNLLRPNDHLHLVHVIPRLVFSSTFGVPPVDFVPAADSTEYERHLAKAEAFILAKFVRQLPSDYTGAAPVVHIIKSETDTESVGHVLVKKADALGACFLALATNSRSRVAELFLGSVTQHVLHNSRRPVVVVPKSGGV
jgi:nucleotide-binding universal stress UspA family protein